MTILRSAAAVLPFVFFSADACASTHDHLFANTFEKPADAPATVAEAVRFLQQATFGATPSDVNRVMAVGRKEWLDEQMGLPATTGFAKVQSIVNARTADTVNHPGVGQAQRINRWLYQSAYAPDQVRQRMAYALSQIFVVSDQSSALSQDVVPMTAYYDLLTRDAFEYYRVVLNDVTYSPTMGKYLNAFHNLKPTFKSVSGVQTQITSPDENYAREVMQLFSIGLVELNLDGSPNGANVATYDQTVITHTAKIFTGFTYSDAPNGTSPNFYGGGVNFTTQSAPMACWGTELFSYDNSNMRHDITDDNGKLAGSKTVLDGHTIPANQDCDADVADELDIISGHPNVAPFISRLLIQRFVTSNPSPAYLSRVATVFKNSSGDLGDTLIAILTDTEATTPPALAAGDTYGKLREPLLRLTTVWRALGATPPPPDAYGEVQMNAGTNFLSAFGQGPLEAPTVFNFYSPDYQQPPTFVAKNKDSPEF
ncbi:MAG TPA: DUF1800 family protein, partial [Rudaea sp.]